MNTVLNFGVSLDYLRGYTVAQLVVTTSQKVAGSIPDGVIIIFH